MGIILHCSVNTMALTAYDEINEIIAVLCGQSATTNAILAALQRRFPSTGWTRAHLDTRLAQSSHLGVIQSVGACPTKALGWQVNKKALLVNYPANKYFRFTCGRVFGGYRACSSCPTSTTNVPVM